MKKKTFADIRVHSRTKVTEQMETGKTTKPTQSKSRAHPTPIGGKSGRTGGVAGRMYMEFPAVVDPQSGGMDAAVSTAIRRRRMAEFAKGKLPYTKPVRMPVLCTDSTCT
jgi:hypothetical protein